MTTVSDAMNKAIEYHQNGNVQEAERIYTEILKVDPNNINCLYLIGLINYQKGKLDNAVDYANRALSIRPAFDIYKTLADIYIDKREFDNALIALKKAVEFDPDYVEGYFNIGLILQNQNKLIEAAEYYKKAISLKSDYYLAYDNLGALYLNNGDLNESLNYYKKSMYLNPNNPDVYFNIGNIYRASSNPVQAIEFYQKSLDLKPNDAECNVKLGISFMMDKRYDQSVQYFNKALELNYDEAEIYFNLGNVYCEKEDYIKAKNYYNKSIELNPNNPDSFNNLGQLYRFNNELNKAIPNFLKALELDPNNKIAQFNLARAYIGNQNFEVGWNYFECRNEIFDSYSRENESLFNKFWKNNISGKTILVSQVGGYGDAIQFSRYLSLFKEKGAKVITIITEPLIDLFRHNNIQAEILEETVSESDIKFDARITNICLPAYFKTSFKNNISKGAYLKADPIKVNAYWEKFFNNNKFKVGIVWGAGNKIEKLIDKKDINLKYLLKFLTIPGIQLYSLQKGIDECELKDHSEAANIIDLGITFKDFSDTAAAIENLDVLVSVDTGVAHLAGAMGKKVFLMLPFFADWRWLTNLEDNLWYDSMKLYRQKEPGNWQELINRVYEDLKKSGV